MKQSQANPQKDGSDFQQRYAQAKWLTQMVSLTVIPLLRWDVGFRLLSPLRLISVNGVVAVLAVLYQPGNEEACPLALALFAMVSFCAGIVQWIHRWLQLRQPGHQHSEYIGTSPLHFRWLPAFLRRNRRVERFIDPLACILCGLIVWPLSPALAGYLGVAGFSLRAYEFQIFERELHRDLDLADGLRMAEYQSSVVEHYEGTPASNQPASHSRLATGIGDDLRARVKRNKSK
jgi:hypothetical protein